MAPDRASFEHDSCHGDQCNACLEGKLGATLITSKTTSGGGRAGKENVCFLCWHLAACFTRHPHTSIRQYLFQAEKSKFASPIVPAGTGRGCVKWISSSGAGHCLPGSIRCSEALWCWVCSFPFLLPSLGHHQDTGWHGHINLTNLLQTRRFIAVFTAGSRISACTQLHFYG